MEALDVTKDSLSVRREKRLRQVVTVGLSEVGASNRICVEQHIHTQFQAVYGAEVSEFLPFLFTTQNEKGFTSMVGCQPAATKDPLFLEAYLSHSVEHCLKTLFDEDVQRKDIIEVGNLVAGKLGASRLLFVLLAAIMDKAGYRWVVFTATEQVRQIMDKLHLQPHFLTEATAADLGDKGRDWGQYYVSHPHVVVGDLTEAMTTLRQDPMAKALWVQYASEINHYAQRLKQI